VLRYVNTLCNTLIQAFSVDTDMNHMVFRGREWTDYTVEYDQAAICTGSRPITLDKPGTNTFSKDVFYLRTPTEANEIANKSKGKNVVIVGSSFIGKFVFIFIYYIFIIYMYHFQTNFL